MLIYSGCKYPGIPLHIIYLDSMTSSHFLSGVFFLNTTRFFALFLDQTDNAQLLLLALQLGITLVVLMGPYGVPRFEPRTVTCKVNALFVLLLWPRTTNFFLKKKVQFIHFFMLLLAYLGIYANNETIIFYYFIL